MKALVGAFNQEQALVGAFSVIVQPVVEPMDRFAALTINIPHYLASVTADLLVLILKRKDEKFLSVICPTLQTAESC